jgi:preprotein translocase subunit SecF
MNKQEFKRKFTAFHDKNYKKLLLIPLILIILSFIYMAVFYQQNGSFFYKDISLTGGTSVTINGDINAQDLRNALADRLDSLSTREISDLVSRKQIAVIVETKSSGEVARQVLESYLGYELSEQNSSFEFTGSSLSESFFKQLMIAIVIAFALMSIVVFVQFRTFVPSIAVILSAFFDIFMTLVVLNLLGIKLSGAGIVALLMLIGYSVDTDILLTNKVLKRGGASVNKKLYESFKTGITMTLTSASAILLALFIAGPFSSILHQIFFIMLVGLCFDVLNTWLTNVSIIKWYALKKENQQ